MKEKQVQVCPLRFIVNHSHIDCFNERCALWTGNQCVVKRFGCAVSEFTENAVSVLLKPLKPIIQLAVEQFIEEHEQEIEDAKKREEEDLPF